MLSRVPENKMHLVRWLLTVGWVILILSAFYDPISPILTAPDNLLSPVRVHPELCVLEHGICLPQVSYALAPRIFWGIVIPAGVLILLIGGHETWRRICPLYFLSQIPRKLGIQRKRKKTNAETGAVRQELVGVDAQSWLGKNYAYVQLGLFFLGLNIRLLAADGTALGFGIFMVATIAAAITVGYLFKGRSWCQYFCPMAPVQVFYTSNRGLLGSNAHMSPPASVTQSMCRSIDANGKEKSACVSCQSPCLDIDAERTYWANLDRPEQLLLFYGYFGLMLGFFLYYFLHSGNWDYYFSGVWSHHERPISSILEPGFYIAGRSIPIPEIIAAPLTLGVFTTASYWGGFGLEKLIKSQRQQWTDQQVRHVSYVITVFLSFNVFFIFAGRPNLKLLPPWMELVFNGFLMLVSVLWLNRNLSRSKQLYQRESLTGSLRRQLQKLAVSWTEFLEGRSIEDLNTNEVYVLAKVLPGFNRQSRLQVYQGVLQEAVAEGKAQSANSLEMLQDIRTELQVTTEEHYQILNNLGIENPALLDPTVQRSREDQLRLDSYQRGLEVLMLDLIASHMPIEQALQQKQAQINLMRQEYGISTAEQEQVLLTLFHPNSALLTTSTKLLGKLQIWSTRQQSLTIIPPQPQAPIYQLLQSIVSDQQRLMVVQLLNILEMLADEPAALEIANTTSILAPGIVQELLDVGTKKRLSPQICQRLVHQKPVTTDTIKTVLINPLDSLDATILNDTITQITQLNSQSLPMMGLVEVLQDLLQEIDPLVKAASLYALQQLEPELTRRIVHTLERGSEPLLQELIDQILQRSQTIEQVPTLTLDLEIHGQYDQQVFQQAVVSVGRSEENNLVILDRQVSRQHALFKVNSKGLIIRDLGSSNGLRIKQEYLHNEEQTIPSGTKIHLCPSDDILVTAHWSMIAAKSQEQPITILEKMLWLRSSPLFQTLNHQSLLALAQSSSLSIYTQNQILCERGEPAQALWLLLGGTVQSDHRTLSVGQMIGELGILTRRTYAETVVVTSPQVSVLVISATGFDDLLDREPQISRSLLASISQRLQTSL